jgi:hypothetical protein
MPLPVLWMNAKHSRHFVASGGGKKQHGDEEKDYSGIHGFGGTSGG